MLLFCRALRREWHRNLFESCMKMNVLRCINVRQRIKDVFFIYFSNIRRGRKLNSQLERAIQEAMTELDRIPTTTTTAQRTTVSEVKSLTVSTNPVSSKTMRTRLTRATAAQQKTKLIKIAPKKSFQA